MSITANSNAFTVYNAYLIPLMDECINLLGDAAIFSTYDVNSGYWLVEIAVGDCEKTALASPRVFSQFIQMLFGLKNEAEISQRVIGVILSVEKVQFAQ